VHLAVSLTASAQSEAKNKTGGRKAIKNKKKRGTNELRLNEFLGSRPLTRTSS